MYDNNPQSPRDIVVITGANGYLGSHLVAKALEAGYHVRATVREDRRGDELRDDLTRVGQASLENLEIVLAELDADAGWAGAMDGARFVLHAASPFPASAPAHEDEVIVPARDGALRVLRAARDAGVERTVMTSSYAAVGYSPKESASYTEADWTDSEGDLQPYIKSKVVAERAAWDFATANPGFELVVINPVGIFGPALGPKLSTSVGFVKAMLDGAMKSVPRQHFGVVDVRDTAALHLAALTHPAASGERFLAVADGPSVSFLDVARMLKESLGERASRVPDVEDVLSSDGSDAATIPLISNAKAKQVLGWVPRPVRETIVATADSLTGLGLVDQ